MLQNCARLFNPLRQSRLKTDTSQGAIGAAAIIQEERILLFRVARLYIFLPKEIMLLITCHITVLGCLTHCANHD